MSFTAAASLAVLLILETFFPFFHDRPDRFRHIARNAAWGIGNFALVALIFSTATLGALRWTEDHSFGLLNWLGLSGLPAAAAAFVLFDLWMFGWHYANHRIPFFWRFHRMHHTDPAMDCTTAVRFHLGEIAWSGVARLAVLPLLGMRASHLLLYEACVHPVIQFHHSNVALPERWDRFLRAVIVTPNMHRVHHSLERAETNSNYSTIFSFWDRLVQTFRRRDTRTVRFGIPEFPEERWQTLPGMLKTPFVEVTPP